MEEGHKLGLAFCPVLHRSTFVSTTVQKRLFKRTGCHGDPRRGIRLRLDSASLMSLREFCIAQDVSFKTFVAMALVRCVTDPIFIHMVRQRERMLRKNRLAKRTIYRHRHLL
jgi:hypothetical protein